jgi:hypothetical protein
MEAIRRIELQLRVYMPATDDRFSVAAHLFALGYVVAPVRYSNTEHCSVHCYLRSVIWRSDSAARQTHFERFRDVLLESCAAAVELDVLTGTAAGIVALRYWHPVGEAWARYALPSTPAVLDGISGGAYHIYRHPGGRVPSGHRIVTPFPDAILVKILGEFEAMPIWAGAYDQVGRWPPIHELPMYDPAWIERGMWR